jgi:Ca-activated chloride channel homolog
MIFINPAFLLLLILLPIAITFLIWRERLRREKWLRMGDFSLVAGLTPQISQTRRYLKSGLWLVALGFVIIALARPVWGQEVQIVETQGVSVMVVLDVSNSMNARDVAPSRLERAKLSLNDLFTGLVGNEVGLILFAGDAFVQFPLTVDTTSASTFLKAVSSDAITRQGTDIDSALRLAIDSLQFRARSQQFIILVTDGENHDGDPSQAADLAAEQNITIHTIGYGNPDGAQIPLLDAAGNEIGFRTDSAGNIVLSKLDETTLELIAQGTGGIYQRASSSGEDIANLIASINQAEASDLGTRFEGPGVERFGIFVALALAALSLEMLLSDVRGAAR